MEPERNRSGTRAELDASVKFQALGSRCHVSGSRYHVSGVKRLVLSSATVPLGFYYSSTIVPGHNSKYLLYLRLYPILTPKQSNSSRLHI